MNDPDVAAADRTIAVYAAISRTPVKLVAQRRAEHRRRAELVRELASIVDGRRGARLARDLRALADRTEQEAG